MRAYKPVAFRSKEHLAIEDTLDPEAEPCADSEEKAEREKRLLEYAKQVKKKTPIEYKKEA